MKVSNIDARSNDGSTKVTKSVKSLALADEIKYLDGNYTPHINSHENVYCLV